jgi:hypothetical protein
MLMQQPAPIPTPPPNVRVTKDGIVVFDQPGAPLTAQDIPAIRARRQELSNQLQSADSRRERLVEQLAEASGADREGIEQRIRLLDERILRLESDIAETGRQLTSAPGGIAIVEQREEAPVAFGILSPGQVTAISIVFTLAVLAPMAMAMARRIWRRAAAPASAPEMREISQRLERLEQAVDTVAIEMERVSEGQRYVSRVLSEGAAPRALGAGQRPAEPLRVPDKDALKVPRGES